MSIVLLLLFIIFLSIYFSKQIVRKKSPKKWIVLLTMCVAPIGLPQKDIDYRKNIYFKQLNRWLTETDLDIFVVESSGFDFGISSPKLHIISLNITDKLNSASQYEALSILYALNRMQNYEQYQNATHILKVTGRYFLPDIEKVLDSQSDDDLYLQMFNCKEWQNSEYYGIRKELFYDFISTVGLNDNMEIKLREYQNKHSFSIVGPFPNNVPRGGDKITIWRL